MPATTASRITEPSAAADLRWNAAQNVAAHAEALAAARRCAKPVPRCYQQARAAGMRHRAGRCLAAARMLEAGASMDAARAAAEGATVAMAWVHGGRA